MDRPPYGTPEYHRWYREQNRERLLEYDRRRWQVRKDAQNAKKREKRVTDPEYRARDIARSKAYHAEHREEHKAKMRENYHANAAEISESRKEYFAQYREENREACRDRCRPHYRKNKAKRRAAKLQRTPTWADSAAIKFFYECCPEGCHVDHIIPLRGKVVSGLHIAENLQWLPAEENLRKGNSYGI